MNDARFVGMSCGGLIKIILEFTSRNGGHQLFGEVFCACFGMSNKDWMMFRLSKGLSGNEGGKQSCL